MPYAELTERCLARGLDASAHSDVAAALAAARRDAGPGDIIYIGGSTFIVADALSKQ